MSTASGDAFDQLSRSSGTSHKPDINLEGIIYHLTTSWGDYYEGTTRKWEGSDPIKYYIGGTPYASGAPELSGLFTMTPLMHQRAEMAFSLWDDLINRKLEAAQTAEYGQIQFEYSTGTREKGTDTYTTPYLGDSSKGPYKNDQYAIAREEVWMGANQTDQNTDAVIGYGGYGYQGYIHEIGHALGLSHPGSYNAEPGLTVNYENYAEYSKDSPKYTIMSYFGGYDPISRKWVRDLEYDNYKFGSTPMVDDISAVQSIYGADMTTRTDDTTYGFNNTANRDVYDFTVNRQAIFAIWDAGGDDTIDTSGFDADQTIRLTAGSHSSIGGMTDNIAIARNVTIENAVGGTGNDRITGNEADNQLTGGSGNDTLSGGVGSDLLRGEDGVDSLSGGAGDDFLSGGEGRDEVKGDAGNDLLFGDEGDDEVDGGAGDDLVFGGTGHDTVSGGTGNDKLWGEAGDDLMHGGEGDDTVFGAAGNDEVHGGAGDDFLGAGDGNDTAHGGAGNDEVHGEAGDDRLSGNDGQDGLYGEAGDDTLDGEAGHDTLFGGEGRDLVRGGGDDDVLFGGDADDTLLGGSGGDFVSGGFGRDELHGEAGDDLLFGDDDNDTVHGGDGSDRLFGGTGGDVLSGEAGRDQIQGEAGDDRLSGGHGGDDLSGGAGADTLDGGTGADLLFGNAGDDVLTGGDGADIFAFGSSDGLDRITDFVTGGSDADIIAFNGGAFADFAGVQAASRQDGADVVIAHGAGDALTLAGVQLVSLSAANFTFA